MALLLIGTLLERKREDTYQPRVELADDLRIYRIDQVVEVHVSVFHRERDDEASGELEDATRAPQLGQPWPPSRACTLTARLLSRTICAGPEPNVALSKEEAT